MRAIAMTAAGGPEVLVETTRPDPVPAPGELLVQVSASGVNRPDVLQRKGSYAPPPGASDLPGLEIAGTVRAGAAADLTAAGLAIGDPVCALVAGGGYAELCVAPAGQLPPTREVSRAFSSNAAMMASSPVRPWAWARSMQASMR